MKRLTEIEKRIIAQALKKHLYDLYDWKNKIPDKTYFEKYTLSILNDTIECAESALNKIEG